MATATVTPTPVADGNIEISTTAYEDMVAKIKAFVLDNQPRPSTRGVTLTKEEKKNLGAFQRELVKGLSDADKTAFRDREKKARAERKAAAKPQLVKLEPAWFIDLATQVRGLAEALKAKKKPVVGGKELTHTQAFEAIIGALETIAKNPPKTTRQPKPGEDDEHTVIRLSKDGSDEPFNYGRFANLKKATVAAKRFTARYVEIFPGDPPYEWKIISVAEAEEQGVFVPAKVAA